MSWRDVLPWQAKMAAKVVLSRLGIPYAVWRKLALFKHGAMDDPAYAVDTFRKHFEEFERRTGRTSGFVVLELGPGDTLASGIVALSLGASRAYLVDKGSFARTDSAYYAQLNRYLAGSGTGTQAATWGLEHLLEDGRIRYLTGGLRSLDSIPSEHVDLVFSQAVLEHIRHADFDTLVRETHRVLKRDGIASHVVDLRDHLGGSLNNLRFSRALWERRWMATSGFYTNRIRYCDMLSRFSAAGFVALKTEEQRWPQLPIRRAALDPEFRHLSEADLEVAGFHVVLGRSDAGQLAAQSQRAAQRA